MRRFPAVLALTLVAGVALPALPAGGGTEIDDLESRVAAAKEAANAAVARYEEAWSAWAALDNEIVALEDEISDAELASAQLQVAAERRAVDAYMGHDVSLSSYLGEGDVLDVARRAALLDRVTAADNAAVDELGDLRDDLTAQRDELAVKKDAQEAALEDMKAEEARLTAELEASQAALAEAEEAERRAQEEARRQQEEQQEQQASPAPDAGGGGGPSGNQAPVGGIACPVPASSFIDSWSAPRGGGLYHWGIDMMAPGGSPNYAVVSGDMEQRSGSTSGNGVFLYGDNGTLYYYFHLQSYEGGPRHVSQGELIGYTGNTGASWAAPHTHFEMHPGGGASVNPYPSLRAACG
ncbi:MAG: murein hydrolase activator EnvC family protein [Acidimicrobiia bacterium]